MGEAGNRRRKCWNTATDGAKAPSMRGLIRSVLYGEEELVEDDALEEVEEDESSSYDRLLVVVFIVVWVFIDFHKETTKFNPTHTASPISQEGRSELLCEPI